MPQKLIRLTCESNDGVFDGLFDQDIRIKKDSEIAFQSLTLERASTAFNVNNSNNTIVYVSREDGALAQTIQIENKTYEKEDRFELLANITKELNANCDFIIRANQMNSQWKAFLDEVSDLVNISVRPSPFFPLASWNETAPGSALYNTTVKRDSPVLAGVTNAEEITIAAAGMGRLNQSATGALNECYMWSQYPFIKSTGSLRVRLHDNSDGTTNRPAFTIGLTDLAGAIKLNEGTIELTDLVYAVQVDQASTNPAQGGYSYVNAKGSAAVTATAPLVKVEKADGTGGGYGNNDVMEIVIGQAGYLRGVIHQDTGGRTLLPTSTTQYVGESDLYPVIFWHLNNTTGGSPQKMILDMVQCSFDPWFGGSTVNWYANLQANPQLENRNSTLATLTAYDRPPGVGGQEVANEPWREVFELASDDIALYLGYTNKILVDDGVEIGALLTIPPDLTLTDTNSATPYTRTQGYFLVAKDPFEPGIDSESYLVDTQTFMLDSFDSYGLSAEERNANAGGSRRNLLATIPVTETIIPNSVNARVTYEPNTLDYIAIKNRSDIITRQIRMRLLNSRYGDVNTAGLAAMTILIREPYSD